MALVGKKGPSSPPPLKLIRIGSKSPRDSARGVIWQGKVHAGPEFRLMVLFGSVKIHFYDFKILRGTVLFEKKVN